MSRQGMSNSSDLRYRLEGATGSRSLAEVHDRRDLADLEFVDVTIPALTGNRHDTMMQPMQQNSTPMDAKPSARAVESLLAPRLVALPRNFYEPSARRVAPRLLGHLLVRSTTRGFIGGIIVETEAYLENDPACHAYRGPTNRNRAMFGPPGRAYVYFIYGNHWCFNAVCRGSGVGEAVLIRAIEPVFGLEAMNENRAVSRRRDLTSGPAKLCESMAIDRTHNHCDLCDPTSPVFISENPHYRSVIRRLGPKATATRIGISQAADLPLRFCLNGSEFVSRRARQTRS